MLDIAMLATMAACCGLVALLVRWCRAQVDSEE